MKLKKLMAMGLAGIMALGMIGCSTPSTTVETTTPAATTATGGETTAAGGETTEAPAATGNKIFRYSNKADIATFDSNMTNSVPDATISYHIYDGLFRNVQGDIQPAVAESYEVSADGLTYTFHLRSDAKWSDGVAVTANDFEYSWKRLMDPANACPAAYIGEVLKNGGAVSAGEMDASELGVKAIDDTTLEVTLEFAADYFVGMLSMSSFMPVRQDLAEQYGQDFCGTPDKQVYNGPFMVTEYGSGVLKMEKNTAYYDAAKISLDGVEVLTVADEATALAMYESGDLDMAEVPSAQVAQYEGQTLSYYSGADDFAALNLDNEYLANKNLRLAMNYAMNREDYITLTHDGIYEANLRYVLPQVHGAEDDYGTEYPYEAYPLQGDQAKAQEYMAQALEELGVAASDINLKLVVTDTDVAKAEAEVVKAQLESALGITIEINLVPYKTRNAMLIPHNPDFDIIMTGWAPDYSDPYSYLELLISTSSYNYFNYSSEEFDAYMQTSRETSGKERMDALFEAEKVMLDDAPMIPLQLRLVHYLQSDNITGLEGYFVGLNYNYMYVDMTE